MSLQRLIIIVLAIAWTLTLGWPLISRLGRFPASPGQEGLDEPETVRPAEALGERLFQATVAFGGLLRRPWDAWFGQPLLRRRLQVLLGFCVAPFLALFLAIAFGGIFVQLVLVTLGMLAGFVTYASLVGRQELQQQQLAARNHFTEAGYSTDEVARLGGGGIGLFDAGFFEPIPELASREDQDAATADPGPSDPGSLDSPKTVSEKTSPEKTGSPALPTPGFSPPPWSRPAARTRSKGRPIYIEPEGQEKAVGRRAANQ